MKKKVLLGLLGVSAVIGGGLGLDYHFRHREATLVARATDYWTAIKDHDLLTAYHLEAEAAAGLLPPHEVETARVWGVRLMGFSLGSIDYFGDKAEILLTRELTYPDTQQGKTRTKPPVKDLWTFYQGQWYHGVPEQGGSGIRRR